MRRIGFLAVLGISLTYANLQEHFFHLKKALNEKKWKDVVYHAKIMKRYPNNSINVDIEYYLGVGYFYLKEYNLANGFFNKYLDQNEEPRFYKEAIEYKFRIAKKYFFGAKKRLFGTKKLPKWERGKEDAKNIFEEVMQAFPGTSMEAEAQYCVGRILLSQKEYEESLQTFIELIRKHPDTSFAIDAFVSISRIYVKDTNDKNFDLDHLELARINLKNFQEAFPKEEKIVKVQRDVRKIEEIYASNLFTIGKFYERTKKRNAAKIYYEKILFLFPDTKTALEAKKCLKTVS